jgi:hypothetical protein
VRRLASPLLAATLALTLVTGVALALSPGLPDTLDDYWSWTRLNVDRVLENPSGAHPQPKDVYISLEGDALLDGDALRLPFPDGTLVVKERGDPDTLVVDRIYLMERVDGRWLYSFYDRQADGGFSGQQLGADNFCSGCHAGAAETDFVFTEYQRR